MAKGITAIQFIFAYTIFLGFFLVIIGLGGIEYVASGFDTTSLNITAPTNPTGDPLATLVYVVNNIGILFTLMIAQPLHPTAIILHFILTLPALAVLIYIVLTLIRGGGG